MRVAIIIVNWNGKTDTHECLESLRLHHYKNFQTILVDNGSTDGSVTHFKENFPEVVLIEAGENLGFAGGTNLGIRYALERDFDALLLLNNDTVARKGMLDGFINMHKEQPNSVLGGRVYVYTDPVTLHYIGGLWNRKEANFDLIAHYTRDDQKSFEEPREVDYVGGCSLFAPAKIFREVGELEEKFFLFWEETDWCMRAKRLGYRIMYCPNARLLHKVSQSFRSRPHKKYYLWRSRLLLIRRNIPLLERVRLYITCLIPQYLRFVCNFLLGRDKKNAQAVLRAFFDYTIRRFGKGPEWIE
ncbi:MAG: glycosyltransferase family 2 protein [Simkaniaceae bacterium]|nr:glycosyltransferase family 2 protein [Simkaniaceae bacterium]